MSTESVPKSQYISKNDFALNVFRLKHAIGKVTRCSQGKLIVRWRVCYPVQVDLIFYECTLTWLLRP